MRIIIDCDRQHMSAAMDLACGQMPQFDRYERVGWGWHHWQAGARFFVRRIKAGLSVTQVAPARVERKGAA